jgi:hypothetical protein
MQIYLSPEPHTPSPTDRSLGSLIPDQVLSVIFFGTNPFPWLSRVGESVSKKDEGGVLQQFISDTFTLLDFQRLVEYAINCNAWTSPQPQRRLLALNRRQFDNIK